MCNKLFCRIDKTQLLLTSKVCFQWSLAAPLWVLCPKIVFCLDTSTVQLPEVLTVRIELVTTCRNFFYQLCRELRGVNLMKNFQSRVEISTTKLTNRTRIKSHVTIFSQSDWLILDGEASLLWIFLLDWSQLWLQDTIIEPSWGYRRLRVKQNGLRTNLCHYARVHDHTANGKHCGMITFLQWPSSKPGHFFFFLLRCMTPSRLCFDFTFAQRFALLRTKIPQHLKIACPLMPASNSN